MAARGNRLVSSVSESDVDGGADAEAKPPTTSPLKGVQEYRATLDKLSEEELRERYSAELAKKYEEDDQKRFFNKPSSKADFDYWSKMAHWTLDEA